MINKRIAAVAFFLLFSVFASSCRYQVGYPLEHSGKRIFIEVENRSFASQLGSTLNRMIKEEFARSGAYQVTNEPSNAQLLAKVIIENYDRTAQAYQSDDTLLASGFELRLQTRVEIRKKRKNARPNSFVLESRGYAMRANSLEQPKDRQALNDIASDLGSRIVNRLNNHHW